MKTMLMLTLAVLSSAPLSAQSPTMPRPTIVMVRGDVREQMVQRYDTQRERLWCVTMWTTVAKEQYDLVTINAVRAEEVQSSDREIAFSDVMCRGERGAFLPTIHTHPNGAQDGCQASPQDLTNVAGRRAPFDGIQCGALFFIWYFSADVRAAWIAQEQATLVAP